jgi:hypothetical protein
MKLKELTVPNYTFKIKDFQSGVLNLIIIYKFMEEGAMLDRSSLTDNDIA